VASPDISCVVPTYENPQLAERCIRAVLAQSGVILEVIVSDDSRSAAVREVCAAISDPRLSYGPGARSGNPVDNWNAGLDRARGRRAVVVHHDEMLVDPDYLRRAVEALDGGACAVIGGVEVEAGSRFAVVSRWAGRLRLAPWTLYLFSWVGPTAAVVFSLAGAPRFDPRLVWVVDVDFYVRLFSREGAIVRLPGPSVLSVRHGDQITGRIDRRQLQADEIALLAAEQGDQARPWQWALALAAARMRLKLSG
jgi:glycosyltransferase involved in cell wall biosynthesis